MTPLGSVHEWARVFDLVYAAGAAAGDATGDFRGWNDPATGEPLGGEVMRRWLAATVERVTAFRPRRVLELGAGTGNVTLAVAPLCDAYVASDVSANAVTALARRADGVGCAHVEIERGDALAVLEAAATGAFDLVVLTSVAQYFPGDEYLAAVLGEACRVAGPAGSVFVGDVRNAALRRVEHATTARRARGAAASTADVEELARRDRELAVPPSSFIDAARREGRVAVPLLKEPCGSAPLDTFRYDVAICPSAPPATAGGAASRSVRDVPNGRIDPEALDLAGVPRPERDPVDPEVWAADAASGGSRATVLWTADHADGRYDVVLAPAGGGFDEGGEIRRWCEGR